MNLRVLTSSGEAVRKQLFKKIREAKATKQWEQKQNCRISEIARVKRKCLWIKLNSKPDYRDSSCVLRIKVIHNGRWYKSVVNVDGVMISCLSRLIFYYLQVEGMRLLRCYFIVFIVFAIFANGGRAALPAPESKMKSVDVPFIANPGIAPELADDTLVDDQLSPIPDSLYKELFGSVPQVEHLPPNLLGSSPEGTIAPTEAELPPLPVISKQSDTNEVLAKSLPAPIKPVEQTTNPIDNQPKTEKSPPSLEKPVDSTNKAVSNDGLPKGRPDGNRKYLPPSKESLSISLPKVVPRNGTVATPNVGADVATAIPPSNNSDGQKPESLKPAAVLPELPMADSRKSNDVKLPAVVAIPEEVQSAEVKKIGPSGMDKELTAPQWENLDNTPPKKWEYFDTPPHTVYRKNYNEDNLHLPEATFLADYKKQLLYCVMTNDITGLRALIGKLQSLLHISPAEVLDIVNTVSGDDLLLLAVKYKNIDAVRFLLAIGSDPDVYNDQNETPLSVAVAERRTDIINAIIEMQNYRTARINNPDSQTYRWAQERKYFQRSGTTGGGGGVEGESIQYYGPCKTKKGK